MANLLLWLQFVYAVWQFIREAKFFRIPSALIYHTYKWFSYKWLRNPRDFEHPFSTVKLAVVVQGQKWTFPIPVPNQLDPADIAVGASNHFIQCRNGTKYLVDYGSVPYSFALRKRGIQFLCSNVDYLLPGFCIADVYDWGEGFDHYMAEGATERYLTIERVLLMSSREHFLNKDINRLISILPLMLQARGFGTASTYVSVGILVLDQLSSPANRLWNAAQDLLVGWVRLYISRIRSYKRRNAVATFLSTISPRLMYCDEVVRNFYSVKNGEEVLLFGTSCLDHFYEELCAVDEPPTSELNPFHDLSAAEFNALNEGLSGQIERFGIAIGSPCIEHKIAGSSIKTFFIGTGYYNFIDNQHLHYGVCQNEGQKHRIRIALKWIEQNGRMPVTCNHRGDHRAVKFHTFTDSVARGYGVVRGKVKRGSWVN